MPEPGWPRHALRIGRFEFRRTVRALWQDKARFGLIALGSLFLPVIIAGFTLLFAPVIRDAGPVRLPAGARGTVALFWLFAVFLVAQRVASARPRIDAESLVLTTVSPRTAAVGLVLAETFRVAANVGLSVLALAAATAYLFGSVLSLVVLPVVAFVLAATAVVAGSVAGYVVAWLVATVPFVARHKTALATVAAVLFFGGYALVQFPMFGVDGGTLLAWLPIGWFADVAVVGMPVVGSTIRAAGAVGASVVVFVAGGALIERVTTALWFADAVSPDGDDAGRPTGTPAGRDRDRRPRDALEAAVRPLGVPAAFDAPTRRVAEWVLLRTRREPRRLTFLMLPVFFVGSALINVGFQSGSLQSLAAPLFVVVLPWLAGASFAMNPLGDEGAVLPVTLTAVSGRTYVRGLMLPGVLVGLPLVLVVALGAGVVSPYSWLQVLGLGLLGVYLTVVAVATTPAVGMRLPRFSAIRIGQSRAVIPPRLTAVVLHLGLTAVPGSILVLLVVAPDLGRTVVAVLLGYLPAFLLNLVGGAGLPSRGADAFQAVGDALQAMPLGHARLVVGGGLLVGGAIAAAGCYRHAIGYYERYTTS